MKKKILLGTLGGVLLLGVFFSWSRMSKGMFNVYASMIEARTKNAESFWFSHVGIDSLYRANGYKYFMFVKGPGDINIDTLSISKDSLLVMMEADSSKKGQDYDVVDLPGRAFDYLLKDGETMVLCVIDSVAQSALNRYKMRKIVP